MQDRRCRLGLAARIEMVRRRQAGDSLRTIAADFGCSPTTVKTQCDRWNDASAEAREDFSCLHPRRPVPKSCPWQLTPEQERKVLEARERTNWGPMRLTVLTGFGRSTNHKVLARHGKSRRRRATRQTFKRFEWAQPGALLHIDAFKAPKFTRPGHWAHGDRSEKFRTRKAGHTVVIAVQDDHSRLVYAELHSAENAANVSATLRRGAKWMREQGCGPLEAVMSDNAKCYTGFVFRDALTELGARHILTPPYTPRWNGKIERFFGTLEDEWAHGRIWPDSDQRDRSLSSFLRYFNRYRPHSAAGGQAPITRVH